MYKASQKYNAEELRRLLAEDDRKALAAEEQGNHQEAARCWMRMAENLRRLADVEESLMDSARLHKKANACEQKARLAASKKPATPAAQKAGHMEKLDGEEPGYAALVESLIHRSNVTWDDIGGMDQAKHDLKYAMGLLLAKKPETLRQVVIPTRILLHGPSGVGKTLLAAAAANTLGATFYNVKVSNLLSKWFGESSKLVSALFNHARDQADSGLAVVFIDEIESLVGSRDRSDSGAEKRIISTILAEIDGLAEKKSRPNIITIAATNLPWDLDSAFLSRMDLRILVELPDAAARSTIFRLHLTDLGYELAPDLTLEHLATASEGLTGRDIQRMCKKVILRVLAAANEDVPRRVDQRTIRNHVLQMRPIGRADFDEVIPELTSSCNAGPRTASQQMAEYLKWHQQFGSV